MNNEQQTWILNPDVKINDYKVMGSEFLLTESFKLELDGEMGFAPKYLFQPLDILLPLHIRLSDPNEPLLLHSNF